MRIIIARIPRVRMKSQCISVAKTEGSARDKIATDNWLQKNKELLPPCPWQHITFIMPKALIDLCPLLNQLAALVGSILKQLAKAGRLSDNQLI